MRFPWLGHVVLIAAAGVVLAGGSVLAGPVPAVAAVAAAPGGLHDPGQGGDLPRSRATAPPAPLLRYVALGDSVPYGHGLANPNKGTDSGLPAEQGPSTEAWPSLVDKGVPGLAPLRLRPTSCGLAGPRGAPYDQLAFSGAPAEPNRWTGADSTCEYPKGTKVPLHKAVVPNEIGAAGLKADPPSLVTIQAGADDINFGGCLKALLGVPSQFGADNCVTHDKTGYHMTATASAELKSVQAGLEKAIGDVLAASPGAQILLVDYYQLAPAASTPIHGTSLICRDMRLRANVSKSWRASFRAAGEYVQGQLNGVIKAAAKVSPNVAVADISTLFSGHEMCTANSWIFTDATWRAAHPDKAGQQKIAGAVISICKRLKYHCLGYNPPDPAIKVGDADYGSLPAGQATTKQLTAAGGTAPYSFHVYGPDLASVPAWVALSAGGALTVDPPADASATAAFHVYAVDSAGRRSPPASSLVLFTVGAGGAGQPGFAKIQKIIGPPGLTSPQTDCVSATFCLAVGTGGEVHSYDGTGWTDQLGLAGEDAQSVSCASATFCAVSVYNGIYTSDNGTGWDKFYASSGPEQYLSCPVTGQCVVATSSSSRDLDNGVLSGQARLPADYNLLGLGCASMHFCLAMGEAGPNSDVETTTFNGTNWSALSKLAPPENLDAPSCAPGGSCYIVGNGKAYSFGSSGRTVLGAPSGQPLVAVSCASRSSCQASTRSGRVAGYDGHAWSTGPLIDPGSSLATMSCPTPAFCAGQSTEGYTAYLRNRHWTTAKRTDPDGLIAAISCPSASFCAALDTVGEVTFFNGSKWLAPKMVDPLGNGYQAGSIACPSATFCAMVDSNGRAFTFNGTRWSPATKLSAIWLDSVSCATPAMCVAIDAYGLAYVFHGKTWSAGQNLGLQQNGYLQAVSCPAADFCMAVGGDSAAQYYGGSWSKPVVIAPTTASLHAVSCASPAFCLAGDRESSDLVAYFDGTWSKPWSPGQVFFNDAISCLSTYVCVTVGDQGGAYVTGTSTTGLPLSGLNQESLAVDCPSASSCFAGVAGTIEW